MVCVPPFPIFSARSPSWGGANTLGVLLTGMGKVHRASELKALNYLGLITRAQDQETSVVHGMPGEAIALGGATYVRPAEKIAGLITNLVANYELRKENVSVFKAKERIIVRRF